VNRKEGKKMLITYQDIADKLKEIVVEQVSKSPAERDWFAELENLIDELEAIQGNSIDLTLEG